MFSKVAILLLIPSSDVESSSCFTNSLTLGIISLFHFNRSSGCVEVSIVALICISVINDEVEHLSLYLLALYIFLLVKEDTIKSVT